MLLIKRANELMEENKLREAEFMFKAILKENNNNGSALFGLGRICIRLEDFDSAIYYLRRACEHLPKMLDPLFALAHCFNQVGSPVDAKTVLEYTLSIAKHNAQAHYELSQFYLDYGFIDNAKKTLEQGLKCPYGPVSVFMLNELVQIAPVSELEQHLQLLEQLLDTYDNERLKVVAYYALGKCHHRLKNHDQAFDFFQLANDIQLQFCDFKTSAMLPFFHKLKQHFNEDFFKKPTDKVASTFTPTFIVGLPRTGSTLLEQMLVQHSNIGSIGENTILSDAIVPFLEKRSETSYPYCFDNLSTSTKDYCRTLYVEEIKKRRVGDEVVINKLPANFQNLGMIYSLFPEARIIHLTRNFKATAWSVFSNHFAADEPYFCSISEFETYAQAEQNLMAHFNNHIPRNIFTLSYEALLEHPNKMITKTLNFLNQKFEPQCLEYYKDRRSITTLSKAQVRKPISKAPLTSWQPYEKHIIALLNHADETQTNQVSP
ncbi:tetratricopeptide repeat-containing sulfotransferase family protein [Pseudoalteromonas holothuriae]|nr:sulfotransferase [Pseudoalteromonas sp. CIP111854]